MTIDGETRFIRHGHACLGVVGPDGLTLTAGDHNGSLFWSCVPDSGTGQLHTWSPWGSGNVTDGLPGFNGEHPDPVSGSYHLGNGYRAYNPGLRRFNCPDSLSPFGAGGINPYAYCGNDPVNFTDPSGHINWQGIVGIVGGVIGLGGSVFTAGASIAAAGSVMAALSAASTTTLVVGVLGVMADVTGIACGATEDVNPQASSVLGWVSLATAGMATGIGSGLIKSGNAVRRGTVGGSTPLRLKGGGDILDAGADTLLNEVGLLERNGGFRRPLYRADEMPPDHILKYGFRPSTDFTATGGSMIGSQPALIVAERLEGAIRYNTGALGERGHIYMIKGGKIRGSSLIDNMWDNRPGLANFFDDSTLLGNSMSEASNTLQGANYLAEAHVYHLDITPGMISLVPETLARRVPVPGLWQNWF